MGTIAGVVLTPLRIIEGVSGDVLHALKASDDCFTGFGEAYFSSVLQGVVKGWKRHREMKLNIVVPFGEIQFVLFDDRADSTTFGCIQEIMLSRLNYQRLTVPPGVWMAFKGISMELNMLLNIASIPHDPAEAENLPLDNGQIPYNKFR
jgi:dTDP-4-dehydrorhamnose 3,5-epimerase